MSVLESPSEYCVVNQNIEICRTADQITTEGEPSWCWSNADCKVWLYRMLSENFGLPKLEACKMAARIEGFGVNLYIDDVLTWRTISPDKVSLYISSHYAMYRQSAVHSTDCSPPQGFPLGHNALDGLP